MTEKFPQKVLVTGSEGFIGRTLVPLLEADKVEVIRFARIFNKDVCDAESFKDLPEVDSVIHLAANSWVESCESEPFESLKVNVGGLLNVLEFCKRNNAKLIYPSSAQVYGIPERLPVVESDPLKPVTFYGLLKQFGEKCCRYYFEKHGVNCTILRLFNVYTTDLSNKRDTLIETILRQVYVGKNVITLKNSCDKRDHVHIDDVARAFLKSLPLVGLNVLNIASGKTYSPKDVVSILSRFAQRKLTIIDSNIKSPINDLQADISLVKLKLNWVPQISLMDLPSLLTPLDNKIKIPQTEK